jgi:glycosyltransferase involved in cell wall biosynthesis
MRILFFSHYYPPEVNAPASRTSEHCRRWAKAGHSVTVVTCAPNHPKGALYPGYRNRLFQVETIDGVRVVRVWTFLAANEGFARRIANYLSYLVFALLAVPRLERPDIIVSTSPQFFCGLAGYLAKILRSAPWVLEIRDIWPESIVTVGAMRKGLVTRMLERLEAYAYRRADRIVAVTDSFVPHIASRCQGPEKVAVIKNGADLSVFHHRDPASADAVKRKFGFEGRFVAAYAGTLGMAHGLDTVLDAAALLEDDTRFGFLLAGDGAERDRLAARAASMNLSNLQIAGQMPKAEMPAIWAATDVSLILLRKSETFTKVLPSKMFEAMAMGCPIVLGVEGEAKVLLDEAGAGIAITPENPCELAAAIVRLEADEELREQSGRNGAAHVRRHYDRSELAARYLRLLEALACARRPDLDLTPHPAASRPPSPARREGPQLHAPSPDYEAVPRSTAPSPLAGEGQGEGAFTAASGNIGPNSRRSA